MLTRGIGTEIVEYFDRFERGDIGKGEMPSLGVQRALSWQLDESCHRVYTELYSSIESDPTILRAVRTLSAKRLCGGFKEENGILKGLTPFEQMKAYQSWILGPGARITKTHTFAFLDEDRNVVPIQVKVPKNGNASTFTTLVGANTGRLAAPEYTEWATTSPVGTDREHLMDPLLFLEAIRQPRVLASSFLRNNLFHSGAINHRGRFLTTLSDGSLSPIASVEHKKQHSKQVKEIKACSAGYNLSLFGSVEQLWERNVLPTCHFEELLPENYGYDDENVPCVTPRRLMGSLKRSIVDRDMRELDELCGQVTLASLRTSSNLPTVQEFTARKLFDIRNQ